MINFILNASILFLVVFFVTYSMYCLGLFFVLRKLKARAWMAFIPVLNFRELVISVGLPLRWFLYCLVPYAGTIYSFAVAERLGRMFSKHFAYSAFWLTIGSPIGMNMIGISKIKPNMEIIDNPPPNLKELRARLVRLKQKKA